MIAGLKRGAFFGGKWGALIGAIFGGFGLIFWVGTALHHGPWGGTESGMVVNRFELMKAVLSVPALILYVAVLGAVPGALIMGLASGITYRPASRNNENEQTGQNDAAVSSKD